MINVRTQQRSAAGIQEPSFLSAVHLAAVIVCIRIKSAACCLIAQKSAKDIWPSISRGFLQVAVICTTVCVQKHEQFIKRCRIQLVQILKVFDGAWRDNVVTVQEIA